LLQHNHAFSFHDAALRKGWDVHRTAMQESCEAGSCSSLHRCSRSSMTDPHHVRS
jgi:hypothetical protein